MAHYPVKIDQS